MTTGSPTPPLVSAPRRGRTTLIVMLGGLVTTAVALAGVYLLNAYAPDVNVMGWYANYVLPVGAVLVGLVASSGYGAASWFAGVRISRGLLLNIVAFQVVAYFLAQYIEFDQLRSQHPALASMGFLEYFDQTTQSFAFQPKHGTAPGTPMGGWGYVFRLLEIAGFALGSLIVPGVLRKHAYCDQCKRYMANHKLGLLPASVPAQKIKKNDTEGQARHEAQVKEVLGTTEAAVNQLLELARADSAAAFREVLAKHSRPDKEMRKLPAHLRVQATRCPGCGGGWVSVTLVTINGSQVTQEEQVRENVTPALMAAVTA